MHNGAKHIEILKGMKGSLETALPIFKEMKTETENVLNQVISPEMEKHMTPEQLEILNEAKTMYNMKPETKLKDQLEKINKLMNKCQYK